MKKYSIFNIIKYTPKSKDLSPYKVNVENVRKKVIRNILNDEYTQKSDNIINTLQGIKVLEIVEDISPERHWKKLITVLCICFLCISGGVAVSSHFNQNFDNNIIVGSSSNDFHENVPGTSNNSQCGTVIDSVKYQFLDKYDVEKGYIQFFHSGVVLDNEDFPYYELSKKDFANIENLLDYQNWEPLEEIPVEISNIKLVQTNIAGISFNFNDELYFIFTYENLKYICVEKINFDTGEIEPTFYTTNLDAYSILKDFYN